MHNLTTASVGSKRRSAEPINDKLPGTVQYLFDNVIKLKVVKVNHVILPPQRNLNDMIHSISEATEPLGR